MRGERAFGNHERAFGDRGDFRARDEIRLLVGFDIDRLDLFRLGIINRALADEGSRCAINPNVPFGDDVMGLGVVGRLVRVDVGVAGMNGDVAAGGGEPVLIVGVTRGGDLHRLLFGADLSERRRRGAEQP